MGREAKHTPGPWEVVSLSGQGGPFAIRMATPAGAGNPTHYGVHAVGTAENARLIAAAPELLAVLWSALSAANELELSSAHFPREQIEAAIAKAEGR